MIMYYIILGLAFILLILWFIDQMNNRYTEYEISKDIWGNYQTAYDNFIDALNKLEKELDSNKTK